MVTMAVVVIAGMAVVAAAAVPSGPAPGADGLLAGGGIESPKRQMDSGVPPADVECRAGLVLVIRTGGLAACTTPETAGEMDRRGMLVSSPAANTAKVPAAAEGPDAGAAGARAAGVPASGMSVINFYVTDPDLNRARGGAETVRTEGLLEFAIGGVPIPGPEEMTETGPDTGTFHVRLQLPETVNGRPPGQGDIVTVRYLDESDASGESRVVAESVPLTSSYAEIRVSGGHGGGGGGGGGGGPTLVGRHLSVILYEPDANLDSRDEDKIPLGSLQFRGEGGIRTTLANPVFDANRPHLTETGPDTGVFEVRIKVPPRVDGKQLYTGDWYEIRYMDRSTPSGTDEKIVMKGRIGR